MKKYFDKFEDLEFNETIQEKRIKKNLEECVLVYSDERGIFVKDQGLIPKRIRKCGTVHSLVSHDGKLYNTQDNYILNTLSGVIVANRKNDIYSLCSVGGILYDGGDSGIYDTFENKCLAELDYGIISLCSHNDELFFATNHEVYDGSGTKIVSRDNCIHSICSHDGKVFDAGSYDGIYDSFGNKIKIKVNDYITCMVSHEGILYDSVKKGVIVDVENDKILFGNDNKIYSFCFHPRKYFIEAGILGVRD